MEISVLSDLTTNANKIHLQNTNTVLQIENIKIRIQIQYVSQIENIKNKNTNTVLQIGNVKNKNTNRKYN